MGDKFSLGFLMGIILVFIIICFISFGIKLKEFLIIEQCDKQHSFVINDTIFNCQRKFANP